MKISIIWNLEVNSYKCCYVPRNTYLIMNFEDILFEFSLVVWPKKLLKKHVFGQLLTQLSWGLLVKRKKTLNKRRFYTNFSFYINRRIFRIVLICKWNLKSVSSSSMRVNQRERKRDREKKKLAKKMRTSGKPNRKSPIVGI